MNPDHVHEGCVYLTLGSNGRGTRVRVTQKGRERVNTTEERHPIRYEDLGYEVAATFLGWKEFPQVPVGLVVRGILKVGLRG